MSNDSRENLHGTEGRELADLTAATGRAASEHAHRAESAPLAESTRQAGSAPRTRHALAEGAADSSVEGAAGSPASAATTPDATESTAATSSEAAPTTTARPADTQDKVALTPLRSHLPTPEPRPWYRSRRSFSAKGRGGRVQVAGLGLTYTDHETGAVLLADVDLGFRAHTLSAIVDPTGVRARALFLILAGLEEPQAGRVVAAPSRSLAARLAGRIGSVALVRADSPLDESLTIRQNILAPLSATGSVADWDSLVGALRVTGLAQRVDVHPSQLSQWERFKALIARAIVSGAEVFLIEDPVSLPKPDRAKLDSLLRSLASAGCAVVLSTPDTQVAAATDRAILLTNGLVALDAPGPSVAIITTSLEANPEDPQALLGPTRTKESDDQGYLPRETGADAAPQSASEAAQTPGEPRTETALRGIPVVEAEEQPLDEPEVSELVVRARQILSDLPGSIAPRE